MSLRSRFDEYAEYNIGGELMAQRPFVRVLETEQLQKVNYQVQRTLERVQHEPPRSVGPLGIYRFSGQYVDRTEYRSTTEEKRGRVQIWRGTATNRITGKEHPYDVLRTHRYKGDYDDDMVLTLDLNSGEYTINEYGLHTTHLRRYNDDHLWSRLFYPAGDAGGLPWYQDTAVGGYVDWHETTAE